MIIGTSGLEGVPGDFIKYFLIVVLAVTGGAAAAVTIYARMSREGQKRTVSGGPVEVQGEVSVTPKGRRYSSQLDDARHSEVDRRLDGHDAEIGKIWNTVRQEDQAIRNEMAACFKSIERSLGRIEGRLGRPED